MKFKFKKSYKILGSTVKLKIMDSHDWAGLYDHKAKTIYLSSNQSDSDLIDSFFHELIHCVQFHTGIDQAVSRELLEVMAETQSKVIAKIILDL